MGNSVWYWLLVLESHFSALYPCSLDRSAVVTKQTRNHTLGGRQAGHKRMEEERASLRLFCISFQTHWSDALLYLPGGGGKERTWRDWQCYCRKTSSTGKEALGLRSAFPYIILLLKCFPHFPTFSSLLACSSILPSTWGANQVLLLFLSFPNGFHLIPGWVSLEPVIRRLVGLSSSAVGLRTHVEPTWEAGGESLCRANYGHKQTL